MTNKKKIQNEKKTVFLTGATGSIGKEYIYRLSKLGYKIIFTSRNELQSKKIILKAKKLGASYIQSINVDLKNENSLQIIESGLKKNKIYPEILINNAREKENLNPNKNGYLDRKYWQNEFLINVIVPYELSMNFALAKNSKLEKIINISSIYGVVVPNINIYKNYLIDSSINYGTSKAALIHLTKELAVRLSKHNISVNAISYGGVSGKEDKKLRANYSKLSPDSRMLNIKEVFGALKFLISDESSSMNGHNILVDGGWTLW